MYAAHVPLATWIGSRGPETRADTIAGVYALFAEKLGLLLDIRSSEKVTWRGRFRPGLDNAFVGPRAAQDPLPVWVGAGGVTGQCRARRAARAADDPRLHRRHARERQAAGRHVPGGRRARRAGGLSQARDLHAFLRRGRPRIRPRRVPVLQEYLRPKTPGGRGFNVSRTAFETGTSPDGAIMIGSVAEITGKLLRAKESLGLNRVFAQVDWGGLPSGMVAESIARYATEIAPELRSG